jgi:hypothetical protein
VASKGFERGYVRIDCLVHFMRDGKQPDVSHEAAMRLLASDDRRTRQLPSLNESYGGLHRRKDGGKGPRRCLESALRANHVHQTRDVALVRSISSVRSIPPCGAFLRSISICNKNRKLRQRSSRRERGNRGRDSFFFTSSDLI